MIRSSYSKNGFGRVFYETIREFPPRLVVELGVLDGYSTLCIAMALFMNFYKDGTIGKLFAFDLWDDYPYKHGDIEEVQKMLERAGVEEFVYLAKGDAFQVAKQFEFGSVHFLHVDISNTGGTFSKVMKFWHERMDMNGVIFFEGGSIERDQIEWMQKFQKSPIRQAIINDGTANSKYIYGTYEEFPSLTVMIRRG